MSRRVVVVLWLLSSSYDEGYRCDGCGGREERGVVRHLVLMVAMRDRCRTDCVCSGVLHCGSSSYALADQHSWTASPAQRIYSFDGPLNNVYGPSCHSRRKTALACCKTLGVERLITPSTRNSPHRDSPKDDIFLLNFREGARRPVLREGKGGRRGQGTPARRRLRKRESGRVPVDA